MNAAIHCWRPPFSFFSPVYLTTTEKMGKITSASTALLAKVYSQVPPSFFQGVDGFHGPLGSDQWNGYRTSEGSRSGHASPSCAEDAGRVVSEAAKRGCSFSSESKRRHATEVTKFIDTIPLPIIGLGLLCNFIPSFFYK